MTTTEILTLVLEALIVILILWEIKRDQKKEAREKLEKELLAKEKEKTLRIERKLDIGCDNCEEVKKLYPTPNEEFYLCKLCMEGYFAEHPEITEEQKAKIRAKYRVARATKRKEKRKSK
jgi:hypothetical protein